MFVWIFLIHRSVNRLLAQFFEFLDERQLAWISPFDFAQGLEPVETPVTSTGLGCGNKAMISCWLIKF